jgi:hypothetical protein
VSEFREFGKARVLGVGFHGDKEKMPGFVSET